MFSGLSVWEDEDSRRRRRWWLPNGVSAHLAGTAEPHNEKWFKWYHDGMCILSPQKFQNKKMFMAENKSGAGRTLALGT